jgi:hypothetical protein
MRHSAIPAGNERTQYFYEWKLKGAWNKLGATVSDHFAPIEPNSAEEFIFEHYWGYNGLGLTKTMEYQVEHIRWEVAQVKDPVFEADVVELYGKAFQPFLAVKPYSAFFAKGSEICVRIGKKILADKMALPI